MYLIFNEVAPDFTTSYEIVPHKKWIWNEVLNLEQTDLNPTLLADQHLYLNDFSINRCLWSNLAGNNTWNAYMRAEFDEASLTSSSG